MVCKRCGNPLPPSGFTCSFCGCFMDADQIEAQKQQMASNPIKQEEYVMEKYGNEKVNYQKREEKPIGNVILFFFIGLLVLVGVLFLLWVYLG